MSNSGGFAEKWKGFCEKVSPGFKKAGNIIYQIGLWVYRLRRVIMAIPVVYLALKLASQNRERLPEMVGLNLQSTGEFAQMVTREYAVYGPLGVTAVCLLLMFFSRKALYPWIISIFSLVLPYLIYFTNIYPA